MFLHLRTNQMKVHICRMLGNYHPDSPDNNLSINLNLNRKLNTKSKLPLQWPTRKWKTLGQLCTLGYPQDLQPEIKLFKEPECLSIRINLKGNRIGMYGLTDGDSLPLICLDVNHVKTNVSTSLQTISYKSSFLRSFSSDLTLISRLRHSSLLECWLIDFKTSIREALLFFFLKR